MTTSEQARADAMADAETLLRAFRHGIMYAAGIEIHSERAHSTSAPAVAYRNARESAAYAFRAVPGLRGDK